MTGDVKPIERAEYLARIDRARALMGKHRHRRVAHRAWRIARVFHRRAVVAQRTPHRRDPAARGRHRHRHAALRRTVRARKPQGSRRSARVERERRSARHGRRHSARPESVGRRSRVEETVRFFAVDGLRRAMPRVDIRNGAPVVRGCRMIKSAAELALMQKAADITIAAYRHVAPRITRGMTPKDIGAMMDAAHAALGATPEFALILLGEASAYPHGSGQPQAVRDGEVVLMDCGCTVRRLSIRHLAHLRIRRGHAPSSARCGNRCATASRSRSRPRESALPAGKCRRRRACAVREVGLRPGLQAARPLASHRPWHRPRWPRARQSRAGRDRRCSRPACVFRMSRESIYPASSASGWKTASTWAPEKPIWFSTPPPSLDKPFG